MNIVSYIEGLREKPEHIRRRYAFWWAFGITFVIFLFWLASFDFAHRAVETSTASVASTVSSPGQSMVAGVGAVAGDLWSRLVGPKKMAYSQVIVTPGAN